MDATTLAEKIKKQEITSYIAVSAYIEHIKKINPVLNSLVEDRFEEALEEAKHTDEKIKNGEAMGKLLGVPVTIKESFDIKGLHTTGGLVHRKDLISRNDAHVVKVLKGEGAIFLGKTNTPVLCFCQETDNKVYGRTNNPWDPTRTAGGSSGGEGALIGAGGAAVGIGSDIGGSIRFPSHFNGTIGFKSGNNRVSQVGSFPNAGIPMQERMLGIGAIAKSVQDAELINGILADDKAPENELSEFDVVIPIEKLHYPVESATEHALKEVKKTLVNEFSVRDEEPLHYRDSAHIWQLIMSSDRSESGAKIAFNGKPHHFLKEFVKDRVFNRSDIHHYYSWASFGANLFRPSPKKLLELKDIVGEGEKEVQAYLQRKLLILPVYHTTALPHGEVYWQIFSIWKTFQKFMPFAAYANTWGLPSLTIPVAEDEKGLPIGIQVISALGNENAIFQIGKLLEKEMRGYKRAPVV
ncbi:amidase [Oceanobacillus bengalensis]|uniref:Amidase n=2 Tax=Oceanobacillus bengalensis TaxID=1435466 RepID=A0A494YRX1_9BACI|nr:amidase [Oceanobacillus bengalensis]